MMVLDCCAAVDIARGTSEGHALQSFLLEGEKIISSELLYAELESAFGKYVRAKAMSKSEAQACIRDAIDLVDEFIPLEENHIEAFHESLHLNHSVYDMFYFILARRNAATLVTLDTKLRNLCEEQGVDCIHQSTV